MSTRTNTDRTPGASRDAQRQLLRQHNEASYADAMLTLLRPIAPVAVAAWEKV